VASMAACLPEQLWASLRAGSPLAIQAARSTGSNGRSAGLRRSSSVQPQVSRMRCTPSRWNASPEWLAAASASRSGESVSPSRAIAAACSGFAAERGANAVCTSPARNRTEPSGASTTTEPWCTPSTRPSRIRWTSGTWVGTPMGACLMGTFLMETSVVGYSWPLSVQVSPGRPRNTLPDSVGHGR
jgi:hypothetical protein